jgi:hypothetical protein
MEEETKDSSLSEDIDSTNDEEVVETESEDDEAETDDTPTLEDYEALKQKNKELFERAKKAEALAKAKKNAELKSNKSNETNVSEEDLIRTARLASQLDDDDLEVLKTLGGSLAEKIENPLFKAYKESKVKKQKSESASLKPSNGISAPKVKPDMTPEEHKAWVKKLMS